LTIKNSNIVPLNVM